MPLRIAIACASDIRMKSRETPSTRLALEFAHAMASGDKVRAHGFLASKLRAALTPEELAAVRAEEADIEEYGW